MTIVERAIQRLKTSDPGIAEGIPAAAGLVTERRSAMVAGQIPNSDLARAAFTPGADHLTFGAASTRNGRLLAEMRSLKRNVLQLTAVATAAGRAPVVVVTSAVPGDGKSFVSLNLTLSLSMESGVTPVLVDGDIVRQQVSQLFSFEAVKGADLATCLANGSGLKDSVRRTEIDNLLLLPAGEHTEESGENFSSRRWDAVVREMQACGPGFIFIVDTAPVLATADAQYAVALADQAIFVVRSEVSPSKAVKVGIARLAQPDKTAIVFNAATSGDATTYYDYSKPASR